LQLRLPLALTRFRNLTVDLQFIEDEEWRRQSQTAAAAAAKVIETLL